MKEIIRKFNFVKQGIDNLCNDNAIYLILFMHKIIIEAMKHILTMILIIKTSIHF